MTDNTRFTLAKTAVATAGVAGALVLTACSGGTGTTSGNLDDVKALKAVKAVPAVTHSETRTVAKTKRECTSRNKKGCASWGTVPDGTKTVTVTVTDKPYKPGKPAMYCIELDNVGGKDDQDDQWFEVSWGTYQKFSGEDEGLKIDKLDYLRKLSACKR